MGVERCVAWICGLEHVRETIAFPRMLYRHAAVEPDASRLETTQASMRRLTIAIIGAPLDLGAGRRGVDMGPSALRVANLNARLAALGYEVEDLGNVPVEQPESLSGRADERARYLPQIAAACRRLARHGGAAPRPRASCRWCWAAITRWRSARSSGMSRALPQAQAERSG